MKVQVTFTATVPDDLNEDRLQALTIGNMFLWVEVAQKNKDGDRIFSPVPTRNPQVQRVERIPDE